MTTPRCLDTAGWETPEWSVSTRNSLFAVAAQALEERTAGRIGKGPEELVHAVAGMV